VDLTDRLSALSEEISEEQTQLRIIDEQVVFQQDVAEEARIRALVSETPLADREAREAADDLRRLIRSREEAQSRLDELRAEQDSLLERMLDNVREST
jgi:predicted  nucleic acid-binding Zn-ribbon protein